MAPSQLVGRVSGYPHTTLERYHVTLLMTKTRRDEGQTEAERLTHAPPLSDYLIYLDLGFI